MSCDDSSWLNAYASLTATEPIASHMQSVAFAEGETVTYLRGERDWIVVSVTKGDRIFYRKAVIAYGGKVWHHRRIRISNHSQTKDGPIWDPRRCHRCTS